MDKRSSLFGPAVGDEGKELCNVEIRSQVSQLWRHIVVVVVAETSPQADAQGAGPSDETVGWLEIREIVPGLVGEAGASVYQLRFQFRHRTSSRLPQIATPLEHRVETAAPAPTPEPELETLEVFPAPGTNVIKLFSP